MTTCCPPLFPLLLYDEVNFFIGPLSKVILFSFIEIRFLFLFVGIIVNSRSICSACEMRYSVIFYMLMGTTICLISPCVSFNIL